MPARRLQAEVDDLRIRSEQDHIHPRVACRQLERHPCDLPRDQLTVGIEYDFRVTDAGENLQKIFLQKEAIVCANRTSDQQIATVVARNGLQCRDADILRLSQANGIGVLVDLRRHVRDHARLVFNAVGQYHERLHVERCGG